MTHTRITLMIIPLYCVNLIVHQLLQYVWFSSVPDRCRWVRRWLGHYPPGAAMVDLPPGAGPRYGPLSAAATRRRSAKGQSRVIAG